jgi:hypothetical protein
MTAEALTAVPSTSPKPKAGNLSPISYNEEFDINTLQDPRSRTRSLASDESSTSSHHLDADEEVTALSAKLVDAMNKQTSLDDALSNTRLELEQSKEKIRQLEEQVGQQREMLAGDVWVRRKSVESEKVQLLNRVAEEKKLRQEADEQKKKMELELENLTAALFEEANKMVITAKEESRREQEIVQRRNDLLKSQLADTEGLLRSQQEQLAELKLVMEQMSMENSSQTTLTAPSSPGLSKLDPREIFSPLDGASQSGFTEPLSPSHPMSYTHLLQPILRTDLPAFADFKDLIRTSKNVSNNRLSTGAQIQGLGLVPMPNTGNISTVSLATTVSTPSSPQPPNSPSMNNNGSLVPVLPSLKDTKFYKRALSEDVEPTLRLDIAPGVSWLARRTVLTAMTEGTLVVEPVQTNTTFARISKPQYAACALCGESRKTEEHLRNHRFRTSETDSAQRYPLCRYCVSRVRSTCDFLGFLRIVKDGHWRADDDEAERNAWEEAVRLREQMFWSRIGGGVVPTTANHLVNSPAVGPNLEAGIDEQKDVAIAGRATEDIPAAVAEPDTVPTMPAEVQPIESVTDVVAEPQPSIDHNQPQAITA